MQSVVNDFILLCTTKVHLKTYTGVFLAIAGFFFDLLLAKVFAILLILTFVDCVLGYYRALRNKSAIVSKVMRSYAWRFSGYVIASSTVFMIGQGVPHLPIIGDILGSLDDIALGFFIVQEGISILEHLNELNIPLPKVIFSNLYKIKNTLNENKDSHSLQDKTIENVENVEHYKK